jgi:hypothetical protein
MNVASGEGPTARSRENRKSTEALAEPPSLLGLRYAFAWRDAVSPTPACLTGRPPGGLD